MSRSNNTEIKNPAQRFFKWSGSEGALTWYDKEEKENFAADLPFRFLVLDRLTTITGFSDEDQSGIWSNEVRSTKRDALTVRTKNGIKKTGLYEDVKTVNGAKYAQSVYIAYYDENKQLQIGNLKLSGCAVSSWIEFTKGKDVFKGAFKITGAEEGKKGATRFYSPVFEQIAEVSAETESAAIELDKQLQEYLAAYFALAGQTPTETETEDYITQRNRELEDYDKTQAAAAGASNAELTQEKSPYHVDDADIPFALLFAFVSFAIYAATFGNTIV